MWDIKPRFLALQKKFPNHSDFLIFGRAIKGGNFKPETIRRWYGKLVDKEEYQRSDRRTLLQHHNALSTPSTTPKLGPNLRAKTS